MTIVNHYGWKIHIRSIFRGTSPWDAVGTAVNQSPSDPWLVSLLGLELPMCCWVLTSSYGWMCHVHCLRK